MLEIFGEKFKLDRLVYSMVFLLSMMAVVLRVVYFFKYNDSLLDFNMAIVSGLLGYSFYNLFVNK
ncbi:hypothetical protein [Marinilactibacillus psychrotolerans]|uniref:hypothetical protein n=1 Tax=Marinilactibacillus psychrotolerans TaxID=191770 RepID=UPI000B361C1A|nr:hypothetical protein [Marinilactibacillus psychrotolerans]